MKINRIPRDLLATLRERLAAEGGDQAGDEEEADEEVPQTARRSGSGQFKASVSTDSVSSDLDQLLGKSDVVRVRKTDELVGADDRLQELTMLSLEELDEEGMPVRASQQDEDAELAAANESLGDDDWDDEDEGPEESRKGRGGFDADDEEEQEEDEEDDNSDALYGSEKQLLWWRGKPFKRTIALMEEERLRQERADPDTTVLFETRHMVDGAWRRMFIVDLEQQTDESSTREFDAEQKEIRDNIGSLSGLGDLLWDAVGYGIPPRVNRLGDQLDPMALPAEWRDEIPFFKESDADRAAMRKVLKQGRKGDQKEWRDLLAQVLQKARQAKAGRGGRSSYSKSAPPAQPQSAVLQDAVVE